MIPQSMRPILALITVLLGIVVIANHWLEFVSENTDLLTTHVLGFICLISGINFMSLSSAEKEEIQQRHQEDTQTKF